MTSVNDIRKTFLAYFEDRAHTVVPSSPLVPVNDPSLLFTNAGMVQFKNVFTGAETRPYSRAVSSQKCVRAGGKHNDLDNVGYTARHHTFFEMLGNFSFGDYFKEGAIEYAWELVHGVYELPVDRLLVTVYHEDDDAFNLWKKIAGLPEDRILRIATSDNFWAMGSTGPCGPCSEIFYDHGDAIAGGPPGSAEEDGDRWVEIWNLVFMQFNQQADGTRQDLPKPSIDTGLGLERIAAVLQGTHDNYETDLFRTLIEASVSETGVPATGRHAASHRVIADHLRATSFLIADGVLPSNEGRGYVLRRIMRRAMRHAQLLGASEPLLYKLVPVLNGLMGAAYPDLSRAESLIVETLRSEEERFRQTLDRGLKLLRDAVDKLSGSADLPGEVAFKLYDTYGFPLDLTQDAMRAEGRGVDLQGFDAAMERQKAEARAAWAGSGESATEQVWFDLAQKLGASEFVGYTSTTAEGEVTAIVCNGKPVETAKQGDEAFIVVNQTPFYGESGGQVGDTGRITADGLDVEVLDTRKQHGKLYAHHVKIHQGRIKRGDTVHLSVDDDRRARLRANHSATHVLHETLRRVLGTHVTQKGSLVAPDRLRFDFSHPKALTDDQLRKIEDEVNAIIRQNDNVQTRLMSYDEAVDAGALALFGEKYDDEVRVVSMGRNLDDREFFSTELCGGTHVRRLGDIALFKIIHESAVSAGVRRIEALTGEAARQYLLDEERRLKEVAAVLKVAPGELAERVRALVQDRRRLEQSLSEAKKKLALGGGASKSGAMAEDIEGISFLGQTVEGVSPKELRSLADEAKKRIESGIVGLVGVNDGKAAVLVAVTDDLTGRISAVDLVRAGAGPVGGKGGGGRPDMAQAGGPDPAGADAALDAIRKMIAHEARAA